MSVSPLTQVRTDTLVDLVRGDDPSSFSAACDDNPLPLNLRSTLATSSTRARPGPSRPRAARPSLLRATRDGDNDDDDPFGLMAFHGGSNNKRLSKPSEVDDPGPNLGVLIELERSQDDDDLVVPAVVDWDQLQMEAQNLAGDLKRPENRDRIFTDWDRLQTEAQMLAGDLKRKDKVNLGGTPIKDMSLLSMDKFSPLSMNSPVLIGHDDSGNGRCHIFPDDLLLLVGSSPDTSPVKPIRLFKRDSDDKKENEHPAAVCGRDDAAERKCNNCHLVPAAPSSITKSGEVTAKHQQHQQQRKPLAHSNGMPTRPCPNIPRSSVVATRSLPPKRCPIAKASAVEKLEPNKLVVPTKKATSLPAKNVRRSFLATPTKRIDARRSVTGAKDAPSQSGAPSVAAGTPVRNTPSLSRRPPVAAATPSLTPCKPTTSAYQFGGTPVIARTSSMPPNRRSLIATPLSMPLRHPMTPMSSVRAVGGTRLFKPASEHQPRSAFKPRVGAASIKSSSAPVVAAAPVAAPGPLVAMRQFGGANLSTDSANQPSTPAVMTKPRRRISGLPSPIFRKGT